MGVRLIASPHIASPQIATTNYFPIKINTILAEEPLYEKLNNCLIMKKALYLIAISLLVFACAKDEVGDSMSSGVYSESADGGSSSENGSEGQEGVITAGEWNDLEHWNFWVTLLNSEEYSEHPDNWSFYTTDRVSVTLTNLSGSLLRDKEVKLYKDNELQWKAKTDNFGQAELWYSPYEDTNYPEDLSIQVEDLENIYSAQLFADGNNDISINLSNSSSNRVELAFIVDATGSMSDELEFLKDDLQSVISEVEAQNSSADIYTGTVFYRDEQDEYLTRFSQFTDNITNTTDFIDQQSAAGGGDYPEAVHTALQTGLSELQWSDNALCRIAFLILDAPPHDDSDVITSIQRSIAEYAERE